MHPPPMARGTSALVAPLAAAAVAVALAVVVVAAAEAAGGKARFQPHYGSALRKCILFFEGQRSGELPPSQRIRWRSDSALLDGHSAGVDLTGGYYDAGDNVKFGFPMAFTTTVLAWSVLEFGGNMGAEVDHARDAIRWATDYLLKATSQPNKVYVQVGDPYSDHGCWERPEDMDTKRTVITVDTDHRGSEVSAETAAALAAGFMVFSSSDPTYANQLLHRSKEVFEFADKYRGSYVDTLRHWVCPFYCDYSGYMDELVWGAAWLYQATSDDHYWNYVLDNFSNLPPGGFGQFGWDDKHAGISILISKKLLATGGKATDPVIQKADEFVCSVLPESPTRAVQYSPGGLLFIKDGSNMQNPAAISFLLIIYSRYLTTSSGGRPIRCGSTSVAPSRLVELARSQADYILGKNPMGMSYMVGYGSRFPRRIHHRGSSLPSVAQHPHRIGCAEGTSFFLSPAPNPNLLVGAIVGGPNISDFYPDSRKHFAESEPTTYINAPMVGVFAYLNATT